MCVCVCVCVCSLFVRFPRVLNPTAIHHVCVCMSAYRAGYSNETVLLRIVNDILSALDNDNISVLLLLDLSAAFDTIDHQILLSRLNSVFGSQSTALQ